MLLQEAIKRPILVRPKSKRGLARENQTNEPIKPTSGPARTEDKKPDLTPIGAAKTANRMRRWPLYVFGY
ncbi:hypothetical protein RRSWK_00190 [Rhodopirellula sp. SWK7]|nr:hypothetical protein RRSWK_00190 [Rhodopirellula sp. SWK7]